MMLLLSMARGESVVWEKVADGYQSGVTETKAVWWDSTYAGIVPDGDSSTLLVFLGRRPTGGYSVKVEEIKIEKDSLLVVAREGCPKPGSFVIQVLTSPFVAIRVEVPQKLPIKLKLKRCGK